MTVIVVARNVIRLRNVLLFGEFMNIFVKKAGRSSLKSEKKKNISILEKEVRDILQRMNGAIIAEALGIGVIDERQDCQDAPHREDIPEEYSAFSEHNTLSGPFFDSAKVPSKPKRRRHEPRDDLPPSWGNVPDNVGKKGRRKNAARMERGAQEQAAEDDPDDWFGNLKNARSRGMNQRDEDRKAGPTRKLAFGKSLLESTRHFRPPSPPKLLDRIGDTYYSRNSERHDSSRKFDRGHSGRDDRSERDRNRSRDRDRDRDRYRRDRDSTGPRYKGGYSR
ncbi:hypothetical protein H0H92_009083 [Tricholoma furcatifolium]|nr:hypothetical protein H0H92_009083 [Tricholoma furcatifolium]